MPGQLNLFHLGVNVLRLDGDLSRLIPVFMALLFCVCTVPANAQPEPGTEVLRAFGVTKGHLVDLDIAPEPGKSIVAGIRIDGLDLELELHPNSVRSPKYKLRVQGNDGQLYEESALPPRTVRGALRGDKGSRVVGSVLDTGLCAKITLSCGTVFFIEPLAEKFAAIEHSNKYLIYRPENTIPHAGKCGIVGKPPESIERIRFEKQRRSRIGGAIDSTETAFAGGDDLTYVAELGLDADVQFFNTYGSVSATVNRMELVINIMNEQYQADVGIVHEITGTIVRTMEPDPYSTTDASDLLSQFRSEWNNNQGDIQRDVAQLFTGKDLNGGTIGIAWLGVICNSFGYGVVQSNFNNSLSCATDLSAHELGHNWNAGHCNCPNRTMNPTITCANRFNSNSANSIINHRNSRGCLDIQGAINDDWIDRIAVSVPSVTTGTNLMATTENGEANLEETGATVWWTVVANASGIMTVDLNGSTFDTQLQIYQGIGDSIQTLDSIAANDDDGAQLQSKVSFPVVSGTRYDIRVGGYSNGTTSAEGDIQLDVSIMPHGPADFFWSSEPLSGTAANVSNPVTEVAHTGTGSIYLYYSLMSSDLDTGAFLDIATSRPGIIEFTRAETFDFDITVDNFPVSLRWGDAAGELGKVSPNFIDEWHAFNVFDGTGMLLNNTGPVFFDEGYSFSANGFLFGRVDFDVIGDVGTSVDIISTRGSGLIVHDQMQLDPTFGNMRLEVVEKKLLLGDVNCDGSVNLLDVEPFIALLSNGEYSAKADFDGDGAVNLLDVTPFIEVLSGN